MLKISHVYFQFYCLFFIWGNNKNCRIFIFFSHMIMWTPFIFHSSDGLSFQFFYFDLFLLHLIPYCAMFHDVLVCFFLSVCVVGLGVRGGDWISITYGAPHMLGNRCTTELYHPQLFVISIGNTSEQWYNGERQIVIK